jgi:hypothetical protein
VRLNTLWPGGYTYTKDGIDGSQLLLIAHGGRGGAKSGSVAGRLRPALGGIFPSYSSRRRLWIGVHRGLGHADGLLCGDGRFIVRGLGKHFLVFGEQRRRHSKRFYFFFKSRQLEFLLAQNLINIFHT